MEGVNVISNVTARLGLLDPLKSALSGVYNVDVLSLLIMYTRIAKILLKRSDHANILVTETGPFHPTTILWYAARLPGRDGCVRR